MTMYRPRVCYANYVTNDDITVSTNPGVKIRLIDRNAERKWVSTSGDQTATITIALTSEIDTICLLNTNASVFTVKYNTSTDFSPAISNAIATQESINVVDGDNNFLVDGSSNYIVSSGVATRVYNNFYFKVAKVTPSSNVVITITNTTDSKAAQVGQVFIGKQVHEITSPGSQRIPTNTRQNIKELSDGTINKVYVRKTNQYDLTLNAVTPQERANLELLYDINKREALFYIARPAMYLDYFDGLADHVEWINEFDFNDYYNDITNNGFTGIMRLRTAGGIK